VLPHRAKRREEKGRSDRRWPIPAGPLQAAAEYGEERKGGMGMKEKGP
jgi:hypothetical protein